MASNHVKKATKFERTVAKFISSLFARENEDVQHNVKVDVDKRTRQVDVRVTDHQQTKLIVECKFYQSSISIGKIDAFVGMLADLPTPPQEAWFVTSSKFDSEAIHRAAKAKNPDIKLLHLPLHGNTLLDPQNPTHIRLVALLWGFEVSLADEVDILNFTYEEWLDAVAFLISVNRHLARNWLKDVYKKAFWDDGWRYNAVKLLLENNLLSQKQCLKLCAGETDHDTLELLNT